jgi:hypothetical protein
MTNEVSDLLDALHEGTLSLEEVAERFRHRKWPRRQEQTPASLHDLATAELEDPDPYIPGSYDDVVLAYDQHRLTDEQYAELAEAIAQAQIAEDAGEGA